MLSSNTTVICDVPLRTALGGHSLRRVEQRRQLTSGIKVNVQLSIVIPNYNGSNFICSCLKSILEQIADNCEVILVDDGSTDRSVEIVRKAFHKEIMSEQLRLVCIGNSGPGQARNVGVTEAHGEYVAFLDSDDLFLVGFVDYMLRVISRYSPDIIQFNMVRFKDSLLNYDARILCHSNLEGLYSLSQVRNDIFGLGKWFPCNRVFRREILVRMPFPRERTFYEDLATIPYIFFKDFDIYLCDVAFYAYRDNPKSTTKNHKPAHAYTLVDLFDKALNLPPSLARDLMLVNIARSIVFFAVELQLSDICLPKLRKKIRSIKRKCGLLPHLRAPERFFLYFPLSYCLLENFRHTLKR